MRKLKIIAISIFVMGFVLIACNRHIAKQKEAEQIYYTCPMHKEVIEMKPGKCPKCGMTLEILDMDNYKHHPSGSSQGAQPSSGGGHSGHH